MGSDNAKLATLPLVVLFGSEVRHSDAFHRPLSARQDVADQLYVAARQGNLCKASISLLVWIDDTMNSPLDVCPV